MSTLKDRIAALQANSGGPPSSTSSRASSPAGSPTTSPSNSEIKSGTRLKDKISRFDRLGGAPVPRASFGMNAPIPQSTGTVKASREFYGNRPDLVPPAHIETGRPSVGRSASLKSPRSSFDSEAAEKPFETILPRSRSGSNYSTLSSATSSSNANGGTNSNRPSYLSPNFTGDSSYFARSASLRSSSPSFLSPDSPSRPPSLSPLSQNTRSALTTDAVANLPSSPSFKPNTITSSRATEQDGGSEREMPATAVGSTFGSVIAPSPPSSTSDLPATDSSSPRERADTVTAESVTTVPSSGASNGGDAEGAGVTSDSASHHPPRSTSPISLLSNDSPALNPPRPSTPSSYVAQAAAMFPAPKRQSLRLSSTIAASIASLTAAAGVANDELSSRSSPAVEPSVSAAPVTGQTQRAVNALFTRGRLPSQDEGSDSRASVDTAYFSAEEPSLGSINTGANFDKPSSPPSSKSPVVTGATASVKKMGQSWNTHQTTNNSTSNYSTASNNKSTINTNSNNSQSNLTPLNATSLSSTNSSSKTSLSATATTPPTPLSGEVLDAFPSPPATIGKTTTIVRPVPSFDAPPSAPLPSTQPLTASASTSSSTTATPSIASTPAQPQAPAEKPKPRRKKQILVPGKWINSDDEDEEDEEEAAASKGWARIIVSSRAR